VGYDDLLGCWWGFCVLIVRGMFGMVFAVVVGGWFFCFFFFFETGGYFVLKGGL